MEAAERQDERRQAHSNQKSVRVRVREARVWIVYSRTHFVKFINLNCA